MCGFDTTCCKLQYQPKTRNLMLNHKENMPIRFENVDKPESIVGLEEIWFIYDNKGGNHISVFSLVMGGRR